MVDSSNEEMGVERRRQIFHEELEALWEKRLIPKSEYLRISRTYDRHVQLALYQEKRRNHARKQAEFERESSLKSQELGNKETSVQPSVKGDRKEEKSFPQTPIIKEDFTEQLGMKNLSNAEEPAVGNKGESPIKEPVAPGRLELVRASTPMTKPQAIPKKKVVRPEKPKKTPEQLRERNISVVLLTGVILFLFGGLILATSSWGNLNAVWKVIFIGMVSVVFTGMAYIASKLKIEQTSFAFLTLASLFIPITMLSASYYQIFGEYLSLDGGGRGLLGFLGGVLCLGIYYRIAAYFKSKIFIFISIFTFAITCYFGFAYLTPTIEWMLLAVSVFNLLLVWNVEQLKNRGFLNLFKPYVFRFVQFKIIVESFVVFTLFSSNLIYSITLLVISILFLILAVKFYKKYHELAFHFIFTYGYIHFVYNSVLSDFTVIAYASIPLIFMALSAYMDKKKEFGLAKNFKVTSLIECGIVFLYINAMAFQENYAQIFFALMILSAQLVYVALQTKNQNYTYPAYAVFNLACFYLCLAFSLPFSTVLNVMFILQVILYLGLYVYNRHARYSLFKQSVLLISSFITAGILTSKFSEMAWLEVGTGLVVLSGLFFLTYLKDDAQPIKEASVYGFPIALKLGLVAFYPYLMERSHWFQINVTISMHVMVVALVSIGVGYALKKSFGMFFPFFFYSGQILSFLSFVLVGYGMTSPLEVTGLMVVATAINGWSVYLHRTSFYWLPVMLTSAGLYGSLYEVFNFSETSYKIAFVLFAPFIFFLIGEVIGRYSQNGRRYFLYSSHLVNTIAIPLGFILIMSTDRSPFLYITQLLIYLSVLRTHVKWERFVFTYLGFAVLFLQVRLFFTNVEQTTFVYSICLMITAGIITVLWVAAQKQWKDIIDFYLIPFLHITAAVSIWETSVYGFSLDWEIIWVGLVTVQLLFAWYLLMNRNWQNYVAVPLGMLFIWYGMYADTLSLISGMIVLFACVVVMALLSKRYFTSLVKQAGKGMFIDFYRIFGLLFLLDMNWNVFWGESEFEILKIIVSILLPVYFFLMRNFTIGRQERGIYSGIAAVIGLYPYFTIWDYVHSLPLLRGSIVLFFCMVVVLLLSRHYFNGLFKKDETGKAIDAFRIYGLLFLLAINVEVGTNEPSYPLIQALVALMIPGYFVLVRSFTSDRNERKIYSALAMILSLYPFQRIVDYIHTVSLLTGEWVLFACVLMMVLLSKYQYKGLLMKDESGIKVDVYRIYGLLFLLAMNVEALTNEATYWLLKVFVSCLLIGYFLLMRSFTVSAKEREISALLTGILGLYPYLIITAYASTLDRFIGTVVLFGCTAALVGVSRKYFGGIVEKGGMLIRIDFYRMYGFLFLLAMNLDIHQSEQQSIILECFGSVLIPVYFILLRGMTAGLQERKLYGAASIVLILYPYWVIIDKLSIPDVLEVEAEILPLFIVSTILLRKIFNKGKLTQYIEMGVVFALFIVLIVDAMASNTLNDALIIGTISLAAILLGFTMKYKSYFLAGTVTILFNIYMNTNSMWGQMPWWLYLIIGGGLLITIASFFEWKKQKDNRTSKEVLEKNKQRIKNWFNRWN
ncbi:hypothetical protein ACQKL5_18545 [Peribacillus sp. NPDC097675]|uniref:hypothetical protein n=1 Tax=Peribacillus sp. NPDC097675 TaxID=3390618 RepID=UPI003CFBEEBE